jgi:HlyD family secretion protein
MVGGLVFAFWPEPVPVDLAPVSSGPMMVTIEEEGQTRVRDVYEVSAPLSGRIDRINVKPGDIVIAGETVLAMMQEAEPAFLDLRSRRRAEAAVEAAQAAYTLAEADRRRVLAELDFARSEWERAVVLAERGTISGASLDRAELALKSKEAASGTAEASVAMRLSELDTARAELIDPASSGFDQPGGATCCVEVFAPVNGRVLRLLRESAGVVTSGVPLVEIGDPGDLEIVVDLLSGDAVRVAVEADVMIEDWGGEGALSGVVTRVEPYGFTKVSALGIEEQRVNVVIDLTDPPALWQGLGHGFRVQVRIIEWQSDTVARIPASALFRRGGDWAVFAAIDGKASLRKVSLGHINSDQAEILGGVDENEYVVMHPSDKVTDGARIVQRQLN